MRLLLAVLLALLLIGLLPVWSYSAAWGWGYAPSGLFGLVLLVIILMAVFGSREGPAV